MQKQWMIVLASTAIMLLASCGSADTPTTGNPTSGAEPPSGTVTVLTKLLKFDPEKITVEAGTPITWRAGDGIAHTVTTGTFTVGGNGLRTAEQPDGRIDAPLTQEKEVSFTFDEPGTYTYYCSIHKGMNGEAEVTS
ncbi:MAG: cupredoxin domain-containing protein [Pseudonocardiaceae bacterium]